MQHDALDIVIAEALDLYERGIAVPKIIERFPARADLLREVFAEVSVLAEARDRIAPQRKIFEQLLQRLPDVHREARTALVARPAFQFGFPVAVLAVIALLLVASISFDTVRSPGGGFTALNTEPVPERAANRELAQTQIAAQRTGEGWVPPLPLELPTPPVGSVEEITNIALAAASNENVVFEGELSQQPITRGDTAVWNESGQFFNEYAF